MLEEVKMSGDRKVMGSRELSEDEIAMINNIKSMGDAVGADVDALAQEPDVDQRWVSIGRTHLQQGIMALVRAVARPTTF